MVPDLTCRIIRDAGLATFTWLSGSTGFQEFARFRPQANLLQVLPERKICNGKLEIDDDIAQSENFGASRSHHRRNRADYFVRRFEIANR